MPRLLMSLSFAGVPVTLLDQPVERWAEWCYDRLASPDSPNTSIFEDEVAWLDFIEGDIPTEELASIALERFAELHERYAEWTPCYSVAQLSQGLSVLFTFPCNFEQLLFAPELALPLRQRAMRSLVVPYRVYVKGWDPDVPMPFAWDMLWDSVLPYRRSPLDMGETAMECLREILAIDDVRCQAAALHGLNHLEHPDRPAVVQAWIDTHRGEDWNWAWVEACRDGEAM